MTNAILNNAHEGTGAKAKQPSEVAYDIQSILRTCICTLNPDLNLPKKFKDGYGEISRSLSMAEKLMGDLIDRIERIEEHSTVDESRSEHASWLSDWRRQSAKWEQADGDIPAIDDAWKKREVLAQKLATTPAANADDLAAKLAFIEEDLGSYISEMVEAPFNTALKVAVVSAAQIAANGAQRENGNTV